jgi:hypothetical protein
MARPLIAALALPLLCLPGLAGGAELIPHHAFYELHLGKKRGQSNIVDASGGMAIEVSETCDAWLSKQRLRLRIVRDEGEEVVTDNNFTSWESKSGLRYRFSVRNRLNGAVSDEFRGEAKLKPNGGGGVAIFTQPSRREVILPKGTLFPTAQLSQVLDAAHKGIHLFDRIVFDGATIDGPDEISAAIGRPVPLEKLPGLDKMIGKPSWPMRWAFFPIGSKSSTPDYELALRVLDSGVVVGVSLIYEDFEVTGKVDYFEALPRPKC